MFPSLSKLRVSSVLCTELKRGFGNKFCFVIEMKRWKLCLYNLSVGGLLGTLHQKKLQLTNKNQFGVCEPYSLFFKRIFNSVGCCISEMLLFLNLNCIALKRMHVHLLKLSYWGGKSVENKVKKIISSPIFLSAVLEKKHPKVLS